MESTQTTTPERSVERECQELVAEYNLLESDDEKDRKAGKAHKKYGNFSPGHDPLVHQNVKKVI